VSEPVKISILYPRPDHLCLDLPPAEVGCEELVVVFSAHPCEMGADAFEAFLYGPNHLKVKGTSVPLGNADHAPATPDEFFFRFRVDAAQGGGFPRDRRLVIAIRPAGGGAFAGDATRSLVIRDPEGVGKAARGKYGPPVVTISYPTSHASNTFKAYGFVNPHPPSSTMTSGYLTLPTGATACPGTPAPPPAGYDWAYSFINVASGMYTLHVTATSGGLPGEGQVGITIP
jgi:hypothetical protein